MIIRMKSVEPLDDYILLVTFDDDRVVEYDMKDDMKTLPSYDDLERNQGLWQQVLLDESRTCVYWNDYIDLPSDMIYEFGKEIIKL